MKINWKKFNRILALADEIGEVYMSLRDKPRLLDLVALGARSTRIVQRVVSADPYAFVGGGNWTWLGSAWSKWIIEAGEPSTVAISDEAVCNLYDVDGVDFVIIHREGVDSGPAYVDSDKFNEGCEVIRKLAWKSLRTDHVLIEGSNMHDDPFFEDPYEMTSFFRQLVPTIKAYVNAGVSRSYLFGGHPGTGKSCGITSIVNHLKYKSFRVSMSGQSGNDQSRNLIRATAKIFDPDVIILEDLDHYRHDGDSLALIEEFHASSKILFATCNNIGALDAALIRPGRFDELIYVGGLAPETLREIIGVVDADVVENLKNLPIAYITEFSKRTKYTNADPLRVSEELKNRYERFGNNKAKSGILTHELDFSMPDYKDASSDPGF